MEKYYSEIKEYCSTNGAATIWRAWREKMREQNRPVREELQCWPIPDEDMELDTFIAESIIDDFLYWMTVHKQVQLSKI